MVLKLSQYLQIRTILFHSSCNSRKLENLKTYFKADINSQRVFERISSLPYLTKILEKRDALGIDHIDALLHIINEVAPENIEIKNILFSRESSVNSINDNNIFINHNASNDDNRIHEERVLPPVPEDSIERINELIKSSIGIKWKELARALSIPEGKIDDLEYQYRFTDVPRMVHEILRFHQEKCGRNFVLWRSELQKALVKARRKDLSEDIDDILKLQSLCI